MNSFEDKERSDRLIPDRSLGKNRVRKPPRTRHILPSSHFRSVASRLLALREEGAHKTIGIASCRENEGNSTVASNLTVAINNAIDGEVLLIDCVEPTKRILGPGWFDFVFRNVELLAVVRPTETPKLSTISAGIVLEPGVGTYNRDRLMSICRQLKERFEFVIFDLPCANDSTGCFPIAGVLDGVILNFKSGLINSARAIQMQKEFQLRGANVLGAVLNQTQSYVPGFLRMLLRSKNSHS